jgi:UDP-glucose 4-epimerase
MNILVTGGCGFVGSHLVKKLVKDTFNNILVLDNFSTGRVKIEKATYLYGETSDIDSILSKCKHFKPDIIYHLGEYSRVMTSFEDIEKVVKYNALGTLAVVEYCRKNKVRLIYAGSSTKFGDAESPYSFFKANNAELIKKYADWYGLNCAIAYFYNVYGPGQISTGRFATFIGILQENVKNGRPHKINAPGTQMRSFTHIDDIVRGLILIGEHGRGEYCLGSEEQYSILEVAKMFGGEIEMQEAKKGDRNYSDIELQRIKKLGWKAEKSLKNYINDQLKPPK